MRRFPLVTLVLVALNVLAYRQFAPAVYGLIPAHPVPSALVSYAFLHDPSGLAHIAGNMAFLAVFGSLVEGALGGLPFLALYLLGAVAGGLGHVLVAPSSVDPLVGASGAIFGVLAVAGVIHPRLIGFVVAFVGIEVWRALTGGSEGISCGCHIFGFIAGFAVATLMRVTGSDVMEAA